MYMVNSWSTSIILCTATATVYLFCILLLADMVCILVNKVHSLNFNPSSQKNIVNTSAYHCMYHPFLLNLLEIIWWKFLRPLPLHTKLVIIAPPMPKNYSPHQCSIHVKNYPHCFYHEYKLDSWQYLLLVVVLIKFDIIRGKRTWLNGQGNALLCINLFGDFFVFHSHSISTYFTDSLWAFF